jgi:hypothetical protein
MNMAAVVVVPSEFARLSVIAVQRAGSALLMKDGMPFVPGQPEP